MRRLYVILMMLMGFVACGTNGPTASTGGTTAAPSAVADAQPATATTGLLVLPSVPPSVPTVTWTPQPTEVTNNEKNATALAGILKQYGGTPQMQTSVAVMSLWPATMAAQEFATPYPGCERQELTAVKNTPPYGLPSTIFHTTLNLSKTSYIFNMKSDRVSLYVNEDESGSSREPESGWTLDAMDNWRTKLKPYVAGTYSLIVMPGDRITHDTYHVVLLMCP